MATKKQKEVATRSELAVSFGKWVRGKRLDARLTQTEAALRADISRVYLARIEAGDVPSRSVVLDLARALNAPEKEAIHRAGFSSGVEDESLPMAMIHFNMLSPGAQRLIEDHIDNLRKLEEAQRAETDGKTRKRR